MIVIDLAVGLAFSILESLRETHVGLGVRICLFLLPLGWVAVLGATRAYDWRVLGHGAEELKRLLRAGTTLIAAVSIVGMATRLPVSRSFVFVIVPAMVATTLLMRVVRRRALHRRRAQGACLQRVVLIGEDRSVLEMARTFSERPYYGFVPVAASLTYGSKTADLDRLGLRTFSGVESARSAILEMDADVVVVLTGPVMNGQALRRLAWSLEDVEVDLLVSSGVVEVASTRVHVTPVEGLPLLNLAQPRFSGPARFCKGLVDRAVAALLLLVLAIPMLGVAAVVRLTSPGSALYRQERVGRGGRPFTMFKFRSMVSDADHLQQGLAAQNEGAGLLFKMKHDPRVTRVGEFLRRYSLDELPQLLNVLKGDMSLVGPRPALARESAEYDLTVVRRLLVRPGMTGLWQISGRSDLSWEQTVRLDLRYVDNWSLSLDLFILWRTFSAVLTGDGAY